MNKASKLLDLLYEANPELDRLYRETAEKAYDGIAKIISKKAHHKSIYIDDKKKTNIHTAK